MSQSLDLTKNPTLKKFERLLASCRDEGGWHSIWVDHHGVARITTARDYPRWFMENEDRWKFRLSAFHPGLDYVGARVVGTAHVQRMFDLLVASWNAGATGLVDAS